MRILGHVAFFLLLGSICCKSNRNAKFGGKSPKKSGRNQGADVSQSPLLDAAPGSTGRGSGGSAVAGRNGAAAARTAGQQTDDMRLHFLKNNQVTCNDGTAAGWDVPDPIYYFAHKCVHCVSFSLLLTYGSAGFTWRSQKEVADGCYFWKVRIFNLASWFWSSKVNLVWYGRPIGVLIRIHEQWLSWFVSFSLMGIGGGFVFLSVSPDLSDSGPRGFLCDLYSETYITC